MEQFFSYINTKQNHCLASNSFCVCAIVPKVYCTLLFMQRVKKVVSDSPGLVDFIIGVVNSVLNLPSWQVKFFTEF